MVLNENLQKIVNKIVKATIPDRIIALGYINKDGEAFSIFNNSFNEIDEPVELNILIIAACGDMDRQMKADMLAQRCKPICLLTIMLLSYPEVENLVKNNNSFAIQVLNSDTVMYQKSKLTPDIQKLINEKHTYEISKVDLFCWYERSNLFCQLASVQYRFGNYGMAAFCIHQAVEQLLIMLLIFATGYRYGVHNPDRLLKLLRFHNKDANNVFAKITTQDYERVILLRNVYISYRYRSDLVISEEDVEYFFCEFGKLQVMAERIIYPKIESSNNINQVVL